ncbi:NUDIX hydrolase [Thermobifida halotolerans]|uniref:NUDIX hydrolase n=1 Tax=Thermobifida halotolerans TaxID=483545 RepID=A0A399G3Q3_9ACTN|nr:NUDIX hydrolase [Thermobifida halotolerans]UOE21005.1 NUDIX hydrolase [Thermobifida halotolerans]
MSDSELEFFDSLPRTRGAASALLRDDTGRVLLVKPTYRSGWGLPGGVIEMGESPLRACLRECAEELGFTPSLSGLVCVDWLPADASPDRRPATVFVFAGTLAPDQFARVRLPPEELSAARLVAPARLVDYLPEPQARRIGACVSPTSGGVHYLEHGRPVRWS